VGDALGAAGVLSNDDQRLDCRGARSHPRGRAAQSGLGLWSRRRCAQLRRASADQQVGDAGRRLHTGRSRNEQVSLDLRLYLRRRVPMLQQALVKARRRVCRSGRERRHCGDAVVYAFAARAAVLVAHFFLSHASALRRDYDGFRPRPTKPTR
jgi:argininosuccinate lyase